MRTPTIAAIYDYLLTVTPLFDFCGQTRDTGRRCVACRSPRTPPVVRSESGWNNLGVSQLSGWREERERLNVEAAEDQRSLA